MLDLQKFEQRKRHLALIGVLRLVLHTRLAAPADDEDQRDRVRLLVQQRRERIDDVALTAVLQIDERRTTCRKIMPRRDSRRRPLVRRDDVRRMIAVSLHQGVAKSAQLRVGHANEKVRAQDVQKLRRLHDVLLIDLGQNFHNILQKARRFACPIPQEPLSARGKTSQYPPRRSRRARTDGTSPSPASCPDRS